MYFGQISIFLQNPAKPSLDELEGLGARYAKAFVDAANQKDVSLDASLGDKMSEVLMTVFPPLEKAGAEFGYRSAHEIGRYIYFYEQLSDTFDFDAAMDAAIMQKLLPKLHGSKKKLQPVLDALGEVCKDRFVSSQAKIERMQSRLNSHGFASFAEA